MKDLKKDNLYKKDFPKNHKFIFDNNVADVFEDMVNRSVPGYEFLIENIGVMSKKFYQKNTVIYDLGSSLCACSLSILENSRHINLPPVLRTLNASFIVRLISVTFLIPKLIWHPEINLT